MTTNEHRTGPVEVVDWHAPSAARHRERVWSAWLHGRVAGVREADRLLLVVPMDDVTDPAVGLALRLHELGSWDELAPAATA